MINKNFWNNVAQELLVWEKFNSDFREEIRLGEEWFKDSNLNVFDNLIVKNISKRKNQTALISVNCNGESQSLSYEELGLEIKNFSKKLNSEIKSITVFGPPSLSTALLMLTATCQDIKFNINFPSLSEESIITRINLFQPTHIAITSENINKFSNIVDDLILKFSIDKEYFIFEVSKKLKIRYKKKSSNIQEIFTMFTSGSTGVPKGIVHSKNGYLVYSAFTSKIFFDLKPSSIMLCASDAAWINGHTYSLFGPLILGASSILIENPASLANPKNFNEIIKTLKPTHLYLPVTLIRLIRGIDLISTQFNSSKSLSCIGSMGEPLSADVGKWYANKFLKPGSPVINTYFQTETGGILVANKNNINTKNYNAIGKIPSFLNLELSSNTSEIIVKNDWPGRFHSLLSEKDYRETYLDNNNNFRLFDIGEIDDEKLLYVKGRSDDTFNISGHRLTSGEVESCVIASFKDITECAAVVTTNEEGFAELAIFIFLQAYSDSIQNIGSALISDIKIQINNKLSKNCGPWAVPRKIFLCKELPKTKSGKILRRLLREYIINPKTIDSLKYPTAQSKEIIENFNCLMI